MLKTMPIHASAVPMPDDRPTSAGSARLVARFEVSVPYVVKAWQRQRNHAEVSVRPRRSQSPQFRRGRAGLHQVAHQRPTA
jgi:hypothetical protein